MTQRIDPPNSPGHSASPAAAHEYQTNALDTGVSPDAGTRTRWVVPGKSTVLELSGTRGRALVTAEHPDRVDLLIWDGKSAAKSSLSHAELLAQTTSAAVQQLPWLIPQRATSAPQQSPINPVSWQLVRTGDILFETTAQGQTSYEQILEIKPSRTSRMSWVSSVKVSRSGVEVIGPMLREDAEFQENSALLRGLIKSDLADGTIGQSAPRAFVDISLQITAQLNKLFANMRAGLASYIEAAASTNTQNSLKQQSLYAEDADRLEARKRYDGLLELAAEIPTELKALNLGFHQLMSYRTAAHIPQPTMSRQHIWQTITSLNTYTWENDPATNIQEKLTHTLDTLKLLVTEHLRLRTPQSRELQSALEGFCAQIDRVHYIAGRTEQLRVSAEKIDSPDFNYRTKLEASRPKHSLLQKLEDIAAQYAPKSGQELRPGAQISSAITAASIQRDLDRGAMLFTFRARLEDQEQVLGFMLAYPPDKLPRCAGEDITRVGAGFAYLDMVVMDKEATKLFPTMTKGLGPYAMFEALTIHAAAAGAGSVNLEVRLGHTNFHRLFLSFGGIPLAFAEKQTTTPGAGEREFWQVYTVPVDARVRAQILPMIVDRPSEADFLIEVLGRSAERAKATLEVTDYEKDLLKVRTFAAALRTAADALCVRVTGSAKNTTPSIRGYRDLILTAFDPADSRPGASPAVVFGDTEMLVLVDGIPQISSSSGELLMREGVMSAGRYIGEVSPDSRCGGVVIEPPYKIQRLRVNVKGQEIELEALSPRRIVFRESLENVSGCGDFVTGDENYVTIVGRNKNGAEAESFARLRLTPAMDSQASIYDQEVDIALATALELTKPENGEKAPLLFAFGGGEVTRREIKKWTSLGLPVVLISGSGGATDEYLAQVKPESRPKDSAGACVVFEVAQADAGSLRQTMAEVIGKYSGKNLAKLPGLRSTTAQHLTGGT
jgi:hypothetical protein